MKRIGFFGGCFNPPTIAHIEIAEKALKECNLDKLVFVPMGDKYLKKDLIEYEFRYDMLKLYCKYNSKFEVSDMQRNQIERTYAIDTFKQIEEQYPNSKKFYIMGIDNFSKMEKWKNYDELISKYNYIIFKRDNVINLNKYNNIHFIDFDSDISSTKIRTLIKTNNSVNGLLYEDVEQYIKDKGLYK